MTTTLSLDASRRRHTNAPRLPGLEREELFRVMQNQFVDFFFVEDIDGESVLM